MASQWTQYIILQHLFNEIHINWNMCEKYPYYEFYRYLHETFNTWLVKISIDFTIKSKFQFYLWIWCLLKKYGRISSIVEYNVLSQFRDFSSFLFQFNFYLAIIPAGWWTQFLQLNDELFSIKITFNAFHIEICFFLFNLDY